MFVEKLKTLSQTDSVKDLVSLTNYMFPGAHCPLMGSALAVRGITDAMIVVIGTEECAYYTKSLAMSKEFGGVKGRSVSVVLDSHDVTFGSVDKVEKAFVELMAEYKPSCVFLVTTCVVEIIGDDMDSLADKLTDDFNLPVMAVHTEHFKCQDHLPGIERTITACLNIMHEQEKDGSVNVLGQRLGNFATTELNAILKSEGVEVGLMLPSGCTVADIEIAPKASLNIVVNDTALPLAKEMKKRFDIPYVYFVRMADPENIMNAYKVVFDTLGKEMPSSINEKYQNAKDKIVNKIANLKDIGYIYGNTPFNAFELNAFMTNIGMKPLLFQISHMSGEDEIYKNAILEHCDPYVTKTANIAPLQYVYDELKPHLYLGHEYADRLQKKGISIVITDAANTMLGFEVVEFLIEQLSTSVKNAHSYRQELAINIS